MFRIRSPHLFFAELPSLSVGSLVSFSLISPSTAFLCGSPGTLIADFFFPNSFCLTFFSKGFK